MKLIITRPATLDDLSDVVGMPVARLKTLVRRHKIMPAVRVAGIPFFGPREIRRICALAETA